MVTRREQLELVRCDIAREASDTDRRRLWLTRLQNTETLIVRALDMEEQATASPDDPKLKTRASICAGQADLAFRQVAKGLKTYNDNAKILEGPDIEARREKWRLAKADEVLKTKGRVTRRNKRRADMSPEELAAHKREGWRLAKAKLRAKKEGAHDGEPKKDARFICEL